MSYWLLRRTVTAAIAAAGLLSVVSAGRADNLKYQYWATSLSGTVDEAVMRGLYDAVAHGAVGWLDIDPIRPIPRMQPGINLVLYHVGGNCYVGKDCDRFPSSEPTGDMWGDKERSIDLGDEETRKLVIDDLIAMLKKGDEAAPPDSVVGVHLDNVHRVSAQILAEVFNDFLKAVEDARQQGQISKSRQIGYVAKNNAKAFKRALDQGLITIPPLYQINENPKLSEDGSLDGGSRAAQELGRQYCVPVFLKAFGSDVAFTIEQDGDQKDTYVSEDMARQMARMPDISGVAWSIDERRYHPTVFVQGSPVARPDASGRCEGR
jgi:hypothetical protein